MALVAWRIPSICACAIRNSATALEQGRVAAQRAIGDCQRSSGVGTNRIILDAARKVGGITADGAIVDRQRVASISCLVVDPASLHRGVAVHRAVAYGQRSAAEGSLGIVVNAPSSVQPQVAAYRAIAEVYHCPARIAIVTDAAAPQSGIAGDHAVVHA